MPFIADTPFLYCLVRSEFLHDMKSGLGEYEEACIFGTTALEGRVPCFSAMMRNGAQFGRLPIHAFCGHPCEPLPISTLCLWDALSYEVAVHEYRYLDTLACDVFCGDGISRRGEYKFTLDWSHGDYAEMPDQTKCHHIIALESGHLAAMPNNRIRWHEPSWVKPFKDPPDYRVQTTVWTTGREKALTNPEHVFYRLDGEPPPPPPA